MTMIIKILQKIYEIKNTHIVYIRNIIIPTKREKKSQMFIYGVHS